MNSNRSIAYKYIEENREKRVTKADYLIDKWKQESTTGLNVVRVRKSIWGGHIWMQGPKSSQVTPTALTVFTIFAFLVPLSLPPFVSIFIFRLSFFCLSFSFSLYFSFLLLFLLKLARTHTLTSLSIQLFYDLSLSDTSISVLGHSYALRNHIFFVAPHPKIIGSRATMYRWEEEEEI